MRNAYIRKTLFRTNPKIITIWNTLTTEQKEQYKEYCNSRYGNTFTFCETGEPLYFDKDMCIVNTNIIIDLLFKYNLN